MDGDEDTSGVTHQLSEYDRMEIWNRDRRTIASCQCHLHPGGNSVRKKRIAWITATAATTAAVLVVFLQATRLIDGSIDGLI
jgi:hypothetical protein